ncbi:MAG TPA: class I SAM-dependent methyltransferase [Bryobacteraceae bacterium]
MQSAPYASAAPDGGARLLRYDDICNPLVQQFVPAGSKVLDLGCSTGIRAAWLREHRKCWVAGVEIDKAMAALARERCDSLQEVDLDDLPLLPYPQSHFDVLVFGDVLEHLKNPERVLVHLLQYLGPDGIAVISLPTFAYFGVRLRVLLGRFRYADWGILDRTHLHFYTRQTAREMVEQCGFTVRAWGFRPPLWPVLPKALRGAMTKVWPSLFAIQFVIVCARPGDGR